MAVPSSRFTTAPFDGLRERMHTQLDPVTVPPSCRIHRALRLALGADLRLNLTRGLHHHHTAHTRTSTGSGSGRQTELDPVTVPQSRHTYAPSTGSGSGGTFNLTRGLYRHLAAHTRPSTGSGSGGQTELDSGTVPQSRRIHHRAFRLALGAGVKLNLTRGLYRHHTAHIAHFDWLWVRAYS